jgi:hypothetical protein
MSKVMQSALVCHKLLKKTAQEFAGAFYEGAAHDNEFYHYYPKEKAFIAREWGRFVPHARQILAQMLDRADVSLHEKDEILEALIFDRSLPNNQRHGSEEQPVIGLRTSSLN